MTGRLWRVVGGSGGGLLVRESHELTSTEVVERLATQSIVEELEAARKKIPGGFGIPNLTKQKQVSWISEPKASKTSWFQRFLDYFCPNIDPIWPFIFERKGQNLIGWDKRCRNTTKNERKRHCCELGRTSSPALTRFEGILTSTIWMFPKIVVPPNHPFW